MLENNKEQLLSSILDELKELEMLTQGMQDPRMLQELAIKKAQNLLAHYNQLKESDNDASAVVESKAEKVVPENKPTTATVAVETQVAKETEAVKTAPISQPKVEQPKVEEKKPQPTVEQPAQKVETPNEGKWQQAVKEGVKNDRFKTVATSAPTTSIGSSQVKRVDSIFVKSLKSALKLNDRIRYSRELFGGSVELLNSTIDELDQKNNLGEALAYINAQFDWDKENEAVMEFLSLLERRF